MRFKTDENLHPDASVFLSARGHDAITVWDQGLRGTLDEDLAQVCKQEGRVLVSLDLDFSDIRAYPPEEFPGILVLRLRSQDSKSVLAVLRRLLPLLEREAPAGQLWVVDETGVRIRGKEPQDKS